jgi:hypothetical protein
VPDQCDKHAHPRCGGLRTANASSAAVFRMIQSRTVKGQIVTLIMDEMEVLRTYSERAEQHAKSAMLAIGADNLYSGVS